MSHVGTPLAKDAACRHAPLVVGQGFIRQSNGQSLKAAREARRHASDAAHFSEPGFCWMVRVKHGVFKDRVGVCRSPKVPRHKMNRNGSAFPRILKANMVSR